MQSEYDKEIEALRIERAANREKFHEITKSTEQAMNTFRGIGTEYMVSSDELKEFQVGYAVRVSEKVTFVKYFEDKVKMCFRTYLEAGGRYSQHKHNCQEITKVIKGHLIELLDNNKIYEVGQTVIYDSATMHEPYCTIESEYDVTFVL
jgi:hypothetical protein